MTRLSTLLFLVILLMETPSFAMELKSTYVLGADNEFNQIIEMSCGSGDDAKNCAQLCNSADHCELTAPLCRNCYGTSSDLMRELFTDIPHSFIGTNTSVKNSDLVTTLQSAKFALIGDDSLYNYYVPIKSPDLLAAMQSLCPTNLVASTLNPLLLVSLDEENLPKDLQYVICRDGQGNDAAYGVTIRDGISAAMESSALRKL